MTDHRPDFDTHRSEAQVAAFKERGFVARRRIVRFMRPVPAPASAIFPQLCPTRECDWIEGWSSDLVYTDTGYGEDRCVFRTNDSNITGPGLWTFSHVEAPHLLKIVRFADPLLQHLEIRLQERPDGFTEVHWQTTLTALSPAGNHALEAMPEDDEAFAGSAEALARFFATGAPGEDESPGEQAPAHGLMSRALKHHRRQTLSRGPGQ